MPRIVEEIYYDGARERVERLGLTPLIEEIKEIATGFKLLVQEKSDANGGAAVRKLLDARFEQSGGWTQKVSGDIDWTKCKVANGTKVCVGVEVQVSARSDLLVVDMIHLTAAFRDGRLDAGIVIVPSDRLSKFLTDRGPMHIRREEAREGGAPRRFALDSLSDRARRTRVAARQTSQAVIKALSLTLQTLPKVGT